MWGTMARDAIQATRRPTLPRVPDAWRPDLAAAWRALLLSRAVVWLAGLGAIAVWGVNRAHERAFDPAGLTRPFGALGDLLVAPGARWDAVWYLTIASQGYDDPNRAAFFPLYPLLVKAAGAIVQSPVAGGLLVSFAAFGAGLAAFHRLAVLEVGPAAARWAVPALALFPGALWFSAVYSESVFLAVSVGAVLAARTDRWTWAGVLGALAAATRSAGLVLLVPLGLLWLDAWRARRAGPGDAMWLALVPAGLGAFCLYLALTGHDANAPFAAQDTWHRAFAWPWGGVRDGAIAAWDGARQLLHGSPQPVYFTRAGGDPIEVARHNLMLFGFLLLGAALLAGALRRLPLAHGAYAVAALALPLSYPVGPQPLMSLPRFLAVLYPLFLWLGWWLARGDRTTGPNRRAWTVLPLFALGLAAFSALSSTWHWVA
jgi:Mannosyltransferase (PIG-V)